MTKLFVDTSILTRVLLRTEDISDITNDLTQNISLLPTFAIREFRQGPLQNWVYAHNMLVTEGTLAKALARIRRLAGTQNYKLSTAIQAIATSVEDSIGSLTTDELAESFPGQPAMGVITDECRLGVLTKIFSAWNRRRSAIPNVVEPLDCFTEAPIEMRRGLLELDPSGCKPDPGDCCLRSRLKCEPQCLKRLRETNDDLPQNAEAQRRNKALKQLISHPSLPLTAKSCRSLGDALFAFFAPDDATVYTVNIKDHEPLAAALGKKACVPGKV